PAPGWCANTARRSPFPSCLRFCNSPWNEAAYPRTCAVRSGTTKARKKRSTTKVACSQPARSRNIGISRALIAPALEVADEEVRLRFEVEVMVGAGIFDDLPVRGGETLDVGPGALVVDDAVAFRQQRQYRNMDVLGHKSQVCIQTGTLQEQPGGRLVQP